MLEGGSVCRVHIVQSHLLALGSCCSCDLDPEHFDTLASLYASDEALDRGTHRVKRAAASTQCLSLSFCGSRCFGGCQCLISSTNRSLTQPLLLSVGGKRIAMPAVQ